MVQWLRLWFFHCTSSTPGQGTKISHAAGHGQKKKIRKEKHVQRHAPANIKIIMMPYELKHCDISTEVSL